MGVPKFYRWVSERYPRINQGIKESGCPEIDHLYLDLNGVVHNCTHGDGDDARSAHEAADEDVMFKRIFDYLDKIVEVVKPRKLLYMAIDGKIIFERGSGRQQDRNAFKMLTRYEKKASHRVPR